MIDSKLRGIAQPSFDAIANSFIKLKIKPDTITVLAFIIGLCASISIGLGFIWLPVALLWVSGLLDVLDGTVARLTHKSSKIGAYMDLIFDRMVEAGIILGLYYVMPEYSLAYLLFFVAVLFNFSTFIVAGALFQNDSTKSMYYDIGLAERSETFIVFTLMIFLNQYIFLILMLFNSIIFITGVIRFVKIIKSE